jgi:hypothetical protein
MSATPNEQKAIDAAAEAREIIAKIDKGESTVESRTRRQKQVLIVEAGDAAAGAVQARQIARRKYSVSSGNAGKIKGMIDQALPHRAVTRRMTNMVLQTQESWGAIERTEKGKRLVRRSKLPIREPKVVAWLVEACVRYAGRPLAVASMDSNPVAYPLDFGSSLSYVLSNSTDLELRSDSMSNHVVDLKAV